VGTGVGAGVGTGVGAGVGTGVGAGVGTGVGRDNNPGGTVSGDLSFDSSLFLGRVADSLSPTAGLTLDALAANKLKAKKIINKIKWICIIEYKLIDN
jgi:hypothetical protein